MEPSREGAVNGSTHESPDGAGLACSGGVSTYGPDCVPTTWNDLFTYTVTRDPSLRVMWASYAALPSASVSTRSIVPPLTFASAAARTFASVSPVRSVSSGRWGGSPAGACGRADELLGLLFDPPLPDSVPAIADPPRASAVIDMT